MIAHLASVALLWSALGQTDPAPAPAPVRDVPRPTGEEAKRVTDYYFYGRDKGPLMIQLVPCLKVDTNKDSPTKNECIEPIKGPVKKGQALHAWTMWLSPDGGAYDDVFVQFLHEDQVRTTVDVKLDRGFRARTWRTTQLSKAGRWTIKVMRGKEELGKADVQVD
jgi:hypothetical protein